MSGAIISPAGTGKTCLLRALEEKLPNARYRTHYIKVTDLSKRDMCHEIAEAVGCKSAGCYPSLVRNLQEHFLQNIDVDGIRPVLLIDEAHEIRPDVFSMFKLLLNFEMDSRLVVSIIITGQPPLKNILSRTFLEDIARRIAHYSSLRPLTREESLKYISHRVTICGSSSVPFDQRSFDAIFEISRGNLRVTDQLSRKSLEIANNNDCNVVDSNHVIEARRLLWP